MSFQPKGSTPTTPDSDMQDLPSYLADAAMHVSQAKMHEMEDELDESIGCYREAIGTLLASVQTDRSLKRQASVKRRITEYINKGEKGSSFLKCSKPRFLQESCSKHRVEPLGNFSSSKQLSVECR